MGTGTSFWNKGWLAALALLTLAACGGSDSGKGSQADPVIALGPTFASLSANIFQPKCAGCHKSGPEAPVTAEDGVAVFFESQEQLLQAGVVVPGEPDQSLLFQRVTLPASTDGHMPDDGSVLSAAEIEAIRAWIAGLGSNGVILTPGGG